MFLKGLPQAGVRCAGCDGLPLPGVRCCRRDLPDVRHGDRFLIAFCVGALALLSGLVLCCAPVPMQGLVLAQERN